MKHSTETGGFGGEISVASDVGVGTTFTLLLPAVDTERHGVLGLACGAARVTTDALGLIEDLRPPS